MQSPSVAVQTTPHDRMKKCSNPACTNDPGLEAYLVGNESAIRIPARFVCSDQRICMEITKHLLMVDYYTFMATELSRDRGR